MQQRLCISSLVVPLHVGVSSAERASIQNILLDVEVQFHAAVLACYSDDLQDTVCYHSLIVKILRFVASNDFSLIEKFGYSVFDMLSTLLPHCHLLVRVHKSPVILGQLRQVFFEICDEINVSKHPSE